MNGGLYCPVCASPVIDDSLYIYDAERAAAHFCPVERNKERNGRLRACIGRLWNSDVCRVYACGECGFGFGVPFVGGDEEFYAILHEQMGYPQWRWDFEIAHQTVLAGAGKLLDIGAGEGAFLRSIDKNWSRHAVEGSEETRSRLRRDGVKVFQSLSSAAEQEWGGFDVVTMFQTLEHIAEFRETLHNVAKLLTSKGKVLITVPDAQAMIRQEKLTGAPDMPPSHICKWTPDSLALILKEVGLLPSDVFHEPPSFRCLRGNLHLKIIANAAVPGSLAAKAYRVRNKKLRIPILAMLGLISSLGLIPWIRDLCRGGAFGIVASKY